MWTDCSRELQRRSLAQRERWSRFVKKLFQTVGVLTGQDRKSHILHEVTVPDGCSSLDIEFAFSPAIVAGVQNMITLTLFDGQGFRGARHRHGSRHVVHIATDGATPGYLAGPIGPGTWKVEIDTHMVMDGEPCSYSIDVDADGVEFDADVVNYDAAVVDGVQFAARVQSLARGRKSGSAWYRGDLHSHTVHSDAQWTLAALLESAHALKLDFLAVTDHNTVSVWRQIVTLDDEARHGLIIIPGIELTTFWGHALCLGATDWVDWRARNDDQSMADVAREVMERGDTFIIAHPMAPGDPECTGCRWLYPAVLPGPARIVEVWNGPWTGDSNNEEALATWYGWLGEGLRISATAGSDAHRPTDHTRGPGFSVVWADGPDAASILSAVQRGKLYLSSGPALRIGAIAPDGRRVTSGDEVAMDGAGMEVQFELERAPEGSTLRLIGDGSVAAEAVASGSQSQKIRLAVPPSVRKFIVAELRASDGELLALTNAIYLTHRGYDE